MQTFTWKPELILWWELGNRIRNRAEEIYGGNSEKESDC